MLLHPPRQSLAAGARAPGGATLAHEPLHSTPFKRLRDVDIALGIDCDAVRRFELAGPPPALSEARHHFEGLAEQGVDFVGAAVDQEDLLCCASRDRDVHGFR